MTIDINLLRENKGGDPEKVRVSEKRRFRDPKIVDQVIALDKQWVAKQYDMEQKKKEVFTHTTHRYYPFLQVNHNGFIGFPLEIHMFFLDRCWARDWPLGSMIGAAGRN